MKVALAVTVLLVAAAAAGPVPATSSAPSGLLIAQPAVDGADDRAVTAAVREGGGAVEWGAIVIHHTGQPEGSAVAIDEHRRKVVRDPLGLVDHFVISNGRGERDGAIEATRHWTRGTQTPHLFRKGDLPPAISVTLVGDLEAAPATPAQVAALASLLAALTDRFAIPVDRVLTHREVEGRGTTCPGRGLAKSEVLAAAKLLPRGAASVRVESGAGRVSLLLGDHVVQRLARAGARADAPLPVGTWPVCRIDAGGAFGPAAVLAYPGPGEIDVAVAEGRIAPDEAKRLLRALTAGQCPPDDTPLGGEIALHATSGVPEEGAPCFALDSADADALARHVSKGTPVEIVP